MERGRSVQPGGLTLTKHTFTSKAQGLGPLPPGDQPPPKEPAPSRALGAASLGCPRPLSVLSPSPALILSLALWTEKTMVY